VGALVAGADAGPAVGVGGARGAADRLAEEFSALEEGGRGAVVAAGAAGEAHRAREAVGGAAAALDAEGEAAVRHERGARHRELLGADVAVAVGVAAAVAGDGAASRGRVGP